MKKISILIMMFVLSIITLFSVSSYAVEGNYSLYNYTLNENHGIDYDTGLVHYDFDQLSSTDFIVIRGDVVFELPLFHTIFWYNGSQYLGYTYNSIYVSIPGATGYPVGIEDTNTNIVPNDINPDRFKIMIATEPGTYYGVTYSVELTEASLRASNFKGLAYRQSYTLTFNPGRYQLDPAKVVNNDPIVIDTDWVLSDPVEIQNKNVSIDSARILAGTRFADVFVGSGDWKTDFHILVWLDEDENYLGFTITSLLSQDISPELVPYAIERLGENISTTRNLVPIQYYQEAKYFRMMNQIRGYQSMLFDNNAIPASKRVGVKYNVIDISNYPPLLNQFIPSSHLDNYNMYYFRDGIKSDLNFQSMFYNMLSSLGLNDFDGRFLFSILSTLILASMVLIFRGSLGGFLGVAVLSITVFSFVGWLPSWLFLTTAVLTAMIVVFKIFSKTGAGNDD